MMYVCHICISLMHTCLLIFVTNCIIVILTDDCSSILSDLVHSVIIIFLLLYIVSKTFFRSNVIPKYFNIFKYTYLINDLDVEILVWGMATNWELTITWCDHVNYQCSAPIYHSNLWNTMAFFELNVNLSSVTMVLTRSVGQEACAVGLQKYCPQILTVDCEGKCCEKSKACYIIWSFHGSWIY